MYWVSFIIQREGDKRAWLLAQTTGCSTLEEAKELVEKGRTGFTVFC